MAVIYDPAVSNNPIVRVVNAFDAAAGGTELISASGNKAAAAGTATLTPSATTTAYISGFEVTGAGATGASNILVTVTGLLGGTTTYVMTIPAGVTTAVSPLMVEFSPALPASAINTAIVVNVPSFGAGNTNAAVVAHGYQI